MSMSENFNYIVEQFADLQLLRYRVAGFENLSLRQKELIQRRKASLQSIPYFLLKASCFLLSQKDSLLIPRNIL